MSPGRRGARLALRAVLSVAAAAGLMYLLLISVVLATVKCGDSCNAGDADHWRWRAQLMLAAPSVLLGVAALALGFTTRNLAYRSVLVASLGLLLAWLVWVVGFGAF